MLNLPLFYFGGGRQICGQCTTHDCITHKNKCHWSSVDHVLVIKDLLAKTAVCVCVCTWFDFVTQTVKEQHVQRISFTQSKYEEIVLRLSD